ncbi:MAG: hypothetical protein AAGG38_12730 [Planctomycetota bacterium]
MFTALPRLQIVLVAAAVLAYASPSQADFPLTWYASTTNTNSEPDDIRADGMTRAIAYNRSDRPEAAQQYLDAAAEHGVTVILDIGRDNLKSPDTTNLIAYVQRFDGHPALEGWYVYDEPNLTGTSVQQADLAYRTIKAHSDLPVYGGLNANNFKAQLDYPHSHDRRLTFRYVLDLGDAEFEGFELDDKDRYSDERGWKDFVTFAARAARRDGKPWTMVLQANGQQGDRRPLRLPTEAEMRFMLFYPIVAHDAEGLMFWALYRTVLADARPDEPFPHNGRIWRRDVFRPLIAEFNDHFGNAVGAGPIEDGVTSDDPRDVFAKLYRDPDTQAVYLLVVNDHRRPQTATLTLGEAFADSFTAAQPIGTDTEQPVDNGTLQVELAPYGTRAYLLTAE